MPVPSLVENRSGEEYGNLKSLHIDRYSYGVECYPINQSLNLQYKYYLIVYIFFQVMCMT